MKQFTPEQQNVINIINRHNHTYKTHYSKLPYKTSYKLVDIDLITKNNYSPTEMDALFEGLKIGIDLTKIIKLFNNRQLNVIKDGLKYGCDIGLFADPNLNSSQMDQILVGLLDGLTVEQVTIYNDIKYSDDKMELIRVGLLEKLDVKKYANPNLTYGEMVNIKNNLLTEKFNNNISKSAIQIDNLVKNLASKKLNK